MTASTTAHLAGCIRKTGSGASRRGGAVGTSGQGGDGAFGSIPARLVLPPGSSKCPHDRGTVRRACTSAASYDSRKSRVAPDPTHDRGDQVPVEDQICVPIRTSSARGPV